MTRGTHKVTCGPQQRRHQIPPPPTLTPGWTIPLKSNCEFQKLPLWSMMKFGSNTTHTSRFSCKNLSKSNPLTTIVSFVLINLSTCNWEEELKWAGGLEPPNWNLKPKLCVVKISIGSLKRIVILFKSRATSFASNAGDTERTNGTIPLVRICNCCWLFVSWFVLADCFIDKKRERSLLLPYCVNECFIAKSLGLCFLIQMLFQWLCKRKDVWPFFTHNNHATVFGW